MTKTFFTPMTLGLIALGGVGFMFFKSREAKHLVKGGTYQISATGRGDDETRWESVAKELEKSASISSVFIKGKGDTRQVTFAIKPTGRFSVVPGQPMFQIQNVSIIFNSVEPLVNLPRVTA